MSAQEAVDRPMVLLAIQTLLPVLDQFLAAQVVVWYILFICEYPHTCTDHVSPD